MPLTNPYFKSLGLKQNPFPNQATYSEDNVLLYVPEMFGEQRGDFLRKFFLSPLESGQPIIGAVWSVMPGDPAARGFGKSTIMGEEAKMINYDLGRSALTSLEVSEEDARENPILAGYVSFNVKGQGGIANIDSAAFNLTRFVLRSKHESGETLHHCLRERAVARLLEEGMADTDYPEDALVEAVRDKLSRLAVNIDIRNLLDEFLVLLAKEDSSGLEEFINRDVSNWHQDRNGLKYLQVLVTFAQLAGIQHFTFFIDQVEDFTSAASFGKVQKNVKIIRDAFIESEPFRSSASFVFQLHPAAYTRLQDAWRHEELPPLYFDDPLAAPVVIVLKGLQTFEAAKILAERCLHHEEVVLPNRAPGVAPFTDASLKLVWEATKPRPRQFLRHLHYILENAKEQRPSVINEDFVMPYLQQLHEEPEYETQPGLDDRLFRR